MAKRNLPQAFEIDKIRFGDCFSSPSLRHFAILITGWALTVGTHTITQVILATRLHESEHFATIYKFLGKTKWELDRVAFGVFWTMAETLLPGAVEYETVVDDTLNSHVGKRICGISERKTLPSQTCRLQHDAAILTKEFRAITGKARTQQKSPCLGKSSVTGGRDIWFFFSRFVDRQIRSLGQVEGTDLPQAPGRWL